MLEACKENYDPAACLVTFMTFIVAPNSMGTVKPITR